MKLKGLFGIGTAFLFILLGYYLYFVKAAEAETNRTLIEIAGLATMIFFGFLAILGIKNAVTGKN